MSKKNKRMTISDLYWKTQEEGLAYMVTDYCSPKDVPVELEADWRIAQTIMLKLQNVLDQYASRLDDDGNELPVDEYGNVAEPLYDEED